MQTTDPFGGWGPPTEPPTVDDERPRRVLRRSKTDRVAAGVSGGLGEYFAVDPVLFRVVFATSAFFGGVGVIGYLLAWALIPEQGTRHAVIDGWIAKLRKRRVPLWLVVVVGGLLVWFIGFSWWAPHPVIPLLVVGVVALFVLSRRRAARGHAVAAPSSPSSPSGAAVDLGQAEPTGNDGPPTWVEETRRWATEARQANRTRRRRARPVLLATLGVLIVTLGALTLADALNGIVLPTYPWVILGIAALSLVVGLALRRTAWSVAWLVPPAVAAIIAFGASGASLHDGVGQRQWTPTTSLPAQYRLGAGQGVLDLRHLTPLGAPTTLDVRLGAGQLKVLVPRTMNVTVDADVHIGQITVDGTDVESGREHRSGGYDLSHVILPPATASGPALTIDIHVTDGEIDVERS